MYTRPTSIRGGYPSREAAIADLAVRDLKANADVHCERDWPPNGTWTRYTGRVGRVVSVNVQVFPDGRAYVEIAVRFNESKSMRPTWFLPDELRRGYGAYRPPRSRATDGSAP